MRCYSLDTAEMWVPAVLWENRDSMDESFKQNINNKKTNVNRFLAKNAYSV